MEALYPGNPAEASGTLPIPDGMGVAPGQQSSPRRRAHGRGVEVGEAATPASPAGRTPACSPGRRTRSCAVADVVAHDQQDVGRALRRPRRLGKAAVESAKACAIRPPNARSGGSSRSVGRTLVDTISHGPLLVCPREHSASIQTGPRPARRRHPAKGDVNTPAGGMNVAVRTGGTATIAGGRRVPRAVTHLRLATVGLHGSAAGGRGSVEIRAPGPVAVGVIALGGALVTRRGGCSPAGSVICCRQQQARKGEGQCRRSQL